MEGSSPAGPATLKRTLGLSGVLLFGLAYMTPLIVYGTYGVLATASQGTVAAAYFFALVAISFTAVSYCRLCRMYPVAGSAYTYTRNTFNAHTGFMVGWAALLGYFFLPMVIWLIGAAYLAAAFPSIPAWVWIVGFILVTSALNVIGLEVAVKFNIVLMIIQLFIVGTFVALCVHYAVQAAGPAGFSGVTPFFNFEVPFSATIAGAAIAAYSFLGFDAVTTLTEETLEPKKTMPRAIMLIALIGGGIFIIASYTMQMAHPGFTFVDSDSASFEVARTVGGDVFVTVFLAGLILAQFASGISAQASVGRLLYAMGRDNILQPRKVFSYIHPRFKTPAVNIGISGLIGLGALWLDIATSTSFINFGAFIAFTAVNLCVIRIYFSGDHKGEKMGVVGGLIFPLIGAILDILLLISLDGMAIILGLIWFAIGLAYLAWLTKGFRLDPPDASVMDGV
ncbi:MAG: APC family permease [Deltaproteobacteria bacterium]|nr:APC family permease [Deltaproteobacteria bacterium]